MRIIAAVVAGMLLGIIFAHLVFLGGFITLSVWGIVGIALGFSARYKKEALLSGGVFGFVVSFEFLLADYQGSVAIFYRLIPFGLLSLVGLVGGFVLGMLGFWSRKHLLK